MPIEYLCVVPIPEVGARPGDMVVWKYPDVGVVRKEQGETRVWTYPAEFIDMLRGYVGTRLLSLSDVSESVLQDAVGMPQSPRPSATPRLRLVR